PPAGAAGLSRSYICLLPPPTAVLQDGVLAVTLQQPQVVFKRIRCGRLRGWGRAARNRPNRTASPTRGNRFPSSAAVAVGVSALITASGFEDQAGCRAVREQASAAIGDAAFGGADAPASAQHRAFRLDGSGLGRDRPHK